MDARTPAPYYPETLADAVWRVGPLTYALRWVDHDTDISDLEPAGRHEPVIPPHFVAYVRFPSRVLRRADDTTDPFLRALPVSGHITYAQTDPDGSQVFGFDTARDPDLRGVDPDDAEGVAWVKAEAVRMAALVTLAADFEAAYDAAGSNPAQRTLVLRVLLDEADRRGLARPARRGIPAAFAGVLD